MAIIHFTNSVDTGGGPVLTNVTSIFLSDPLGQFGIRRTDTQEIIVADGVALTNISAGVYRYEFASIQGIEYEYYLEVTDNAITEWEYQTIAGTPAVPSVQPVANALTSEAEIMRLYSQTGIDTRLSDLSSGDRTSLLNEIIADASETVESYTLQQYDTIVLVASKWVRRRATLIAAYFLSERRANPTQFAHEMSRVIDELVKVATSQIMIPGVIVRAQPAIAVSSYQIDDRYRFGKLRVKRGQSNYPYAGQPSYDAPFGGDSLL